MKSIIIKVLALSFFMISTMTYACGDNPDTIIQGPFKDSAFENGFICFQSGFDKRDVDFFQSYSTPQGEENKKVDTFIYSDAPVELLSVFFMPIAGKRNVVVLLRWNVDYENNGVRYPYHYEIKTYQNRDDTGYKLNLDSDKDPNLSGYQIMKNGKTISYFLDNAQKIKKYLRIKYGE